MCLFWDKVLPRSPGQAWKWRASSIGFPVLGYICMHTPPVPPAILIQTNIWINLVNLWHIWRHSGRTLPASFCLLLIYKVFEKGWPSWLVQFPATKGHLAAIENGGVNWSGLQTANRGNQHLQSFPKPKHTLQNGNRPSPYFRSPGGDPCFAHYESFSPVLSTGAKRRKVYLEAPHWLRSQHSIWQ